ncbi:MAG: DUF488 family protein [Thermodesulfovibrionia bacterium]|nr:DUF488 family protein [Thermodesulfovibrionia bacterium]
MIKIKRIYDEVSQDDGKRILIDRLWPRRVKKEKAEIDEWMKDIAPSDELRKWFSHDPYEWQEFMNRYRKELKNKPELIESNPIHPLTTHLIFRKKKAPEITGMYP